MVTKNGFNENYIVSVMTVEKDNHGLLRGNTERLDIHGDDVIFIDYDGKVLHAYNTTDFLKMKSMPNNPEHKGLIAQGWNWSFEDAQDYVTKYGALVIGQMYAPEDGATHIMINLDEAQTLPIMFQQTVSKGVEFFWGDGTSDRFEGTGVVTGSHEYDKAGDYELIVKADDDCVVDFGNGSVSDYNNFTGRLNGNDKRWYPALVRGIIFSDKLTSVGDNAFNSLEEYLEYAIVPNGIQSLGNRAVSGGLMKGFVIPPSITEFPKISNQYVLEYIALPNTITTVPDMAMTNAYLLKKLTLSECITDIGSNNFRAPYIDKLVLPRDLTNAATNLFNGFILLKNVDPLPINIVNFNSLFTNSLSLESITIPASVESIGGSLLNCYNLKQITMLPTTPPTTTYAYGNGFLTGLPATSRIIVPYSADHSILAAYKAATGWENFADQIFEAEPA